MYLPEHLKVHKILILKRHSLISFFLLAMLKELKSRGHLDFDIRLGPEKFTVLHLAVRAQDKAVLKYLIKSCKVKINGTDHEVFEFYLYCVICATIVIKLYVLFLANLKQLLWIGFAY